MVTWASKSEGSGKTRRGVQADSALHVKPGCNAGAVVTNDYLSVHGIFRHIASDDARVSRSRYDLRGYGPVAS